ncbi:MAG: hypothetical protein ACPIA7_09365, partial [Akkermansiaceae bacterium]
MGKKSKKKGGGKAISKAARREQLQERREQQLDALDADRYDEGDDHEGQQLAQREFLVGNRVWFSEKGLWGEGDNPNNYRGYVKSVNDNVLEIIPLQSKIDGTNQSVRVPIDKYVFPDFCDFTLRFDVGDRVLCNHNGWTSRKVSYLWGVGEIWVQAKKIPQSPGDSVPHYKCQHTAVPLDDDDCIMKQPYPLRFKLGDSIVFNARKAMLRSGTRGTGDCWLEGIIVATSIVDAEDYAAYKCQNQQGAWHIFGDDDENIARSNANPRDRLLDAIAQHCSRWHLQYLADTYNIEVSTFRDLAIQKSLQYASYQALTWLQYDWGVDVLKFKDTDGNNILHKIAMSDHATYFIREARRHKDLKVEERLDVMNSFRNELRLTVSLNSKGETWLQILVQRGDTKALDTALSPNVGFGWDLCYQTRFPSEHVQLLKQCIVEHGNALMGCILDAFLTFQTLWEQYGVFRCRPSEEESLKNQCMSVFIGENALHHAKLLVQFILDWQEGSDEIWRNPLLDLASAGSSRLFQLFFEANGSMFLQ